MQMEIKIEFEFELFDALCAPDMQICTGGQRPKLNWGGGSIHFELFKFTFVDTVLQFMGFGSYFGFLLNFFEEFLTQGLKGFPNET